MLADYYGSQLQPGRFGQDIYEDATYYNELLDFVSFHLPNWRDYPGRPKEISETALTAHLKDYLQTAARHTLGWDNLQFSIEVPDESNSRRRIDLAIKPCGPTIWIEARKFTIFDTLIPIECKRLPIPKDMNRDLREYVISEKSSTGGIQRFKAGDHGANHNLAAMIGYIQKETISYWDSCISKWISDLAGVVPGWSQKDILHLRSNDDTLRFTTFHSFHDRKGNLPEIELRHLWLVMN